MDVSRIVVGMLWVCLMVLGAGRVSAQPYPNKPIRAILGAAGGGNDTSMRVIAPGLSADLGQPVIIINTGGGIKGMVEAAKAPPDGYTIFLTGTFFTAPGENVPDLVRDFLPITLVSITPVILAVHPSLPVKSVKELIALAKAKPGELNLGSGLHNSSDIAAQLFKSMAGVNIAIIPYKSQPAELTDLLGGQVHGGFIGAGLGMSQIKSGKLRALAVGSAEPSALTPGLPTFSASGLPGYEAVSSYAIFAPGKTPAAIVNRLNQEIVRVLNQADVKEKLLTGGLEPIGSSPEVLIDKVKSEIARVRKLGIQME